MRRRTIAAIVAVLLLVVAVLLTWFFVLPAHRASVSQQSNTSLTYTAPPKLSTDNGLELAAVPLPELQDSQTNPFDSASNRWTPDQVQALWQPLQKVANEGKWKAWGYIIDAYTGDVLLDVGASTPVTPASTTKLLTALVALHDLPYTDRLTTGTSVQDDTVYLWGQGDLLLVATDDQVDHQARVASLETLAKHTAKALKDRGITSVHLDYQDTIFAGPTRLPAWIDQDVLSFAGEVAPYAIDTGRTSPGAYDFTPDSSLQVAQVFSNELADQGIEVSSLQPGAAPQNSEILARVQSAEAGQQLRFMLEHSDNTMAEQYCHLAAARKGAETTFSGSTDHVVQTLDALGVDVQGMSLQDCSGLSSNNKITPKQLVDVLQTSLDKDGTGSLIRLLPRAGVTGTLYERLDEPPFSGNIQAKTGSLGDVSSLAGVLTTTSGQTLIFAIGTNNVPDEGAYGTREYLDDFLRSLVTQP